MAKISLIFVCLAFLCVVAEAGKPFWCYVIPELGTFLFSSCFTSRSHNSPPIHSKVSAHNHKTPAKVNSTSSVKNPHKLLNSTEDFKASNKTSNSTLPNMHFTLPSLKFNSTSRCSCACEPINSTGEFKLAKARESFGELDTEDETDEASTEDFSGIAKSLTTENSNTEDSTPRLKDEESTTIEDFDEFTESTEKFSTREVTTTKEGI
jgi:hypothetical protein